MREPARRAASAAIVFAVTLAGAGAAAAKTERSATYSFEQAWPTALRHLRVDEGFTIVEKDAEAGYIVFEVKEEGKSFSGTLEVVRQKDRAGRAAVRLVLRIGDRPAYMEAGVLDRMLEKLRQEYGEPPPPPEQAPPPKARPKTPPKQ
ncbi:MAG TPA: hypothetical protein VKB80_07890 [Kofleriaceae bacterium]|nr:hypothetical protein [Kofleriaceae bacterium]